MQVTIDQAGRIVIPKAVRERFGLRKNSELELKETAEGIVLKPAEEQGGIVRDQYGWLVITGQPVGDVNWDRLVEDDYEKRMRHIGGW